MKPLLISSITILSLVVGSVIITSANLTETIPVDYKGYNETKIVTDNTQFYEILPIATQTKIDNIVTETDIVYPTLQDLMYSQIPTQFQLQKLLYRLKYKYPERFEPEVIEDSFQRVISRFDLSKPIPATVIDQISPTFVW